MFRGASLGYKSMSRCFFWQHKGRGLTADGRSRMIRTHMFMNNNKRYKSSPRALHLTPFPNRPLPSLVLLFGELKLSKGFVILQRSLAQLLIRICGVKAGFSHNPLNYELNSIPFEYVMRYHSHDVISKFYKHQCQFLGLTLCHSCKT